MTPIIGFNIYRTENLVCSGNYYTVRFCVSKNEQDFELFVTNNTNHKEKSYRFNQEVADSFKEYTGEQVETEIFKIIQSDIAKEII
ncbi:MAG: hypothetical protein CVU68_06110 [Deltaproteobacteria bacterium HGW-Deltaproteobacteria-3]|nr:MAG: hypothetical protein CVU68_06110 [Deltaproteobacteria bacterium HGW-Deltaproteobacteria-3]